MFSLDFKVIIIFLTAIKLLLFFFYFQDKNSNIYAKNSSNHKYLCLLQSGFNPNKDIKTRLLHFNNNCIFVTY